jgi:hypothetical protein
MLPYPARLSVIMLVLVAIVAPISEAQAKHRDHWRSFGYWGHALATADCPRAGEGSRLTLPLDPLL